MSTLHEVIDAHGTPRDVEISAFLSGMNAIMLARLLKHIEGRGSAILLDEEVDKFQQMAKNIRFIRYDAGSLQGA